MSTNATPDKFQVIMQLMPSATSLSFHCKGDTGIYAWRFASTAFSNQARPKSRHRDGHPPRNELCLKNNLADLSMKRPEVVTITQCSHNVRYSKMASQQWKIGLFKPGKENWFIRKWNHQYWYISVYNLHQYLRFVLQEMRKREQTISKALF